MFFTSEQHELWRRDGYLKVERFLSPTEVGSVTRWVEEIAAWPDSDDCWMHHREATPDGVRLSRSENFLPYHRGMRSLLTEGKIPAAVSEALGEPAVLYKEKINYKYPGGGGYVAHQDAPAYAMIKKHVTCLVAIDTMTPENGCLFFAPGLHTDGLIALNTEGCIESHVADQLDWVAVPTRPGDILLFSSYAPHKSPRNSSQRSRRALYLTYNASAEGDLRADYYASKRKIFAQNIRSGSAETDRISTIGHFQGKTVLDK